MSAHTLLPSNPVPRFVCNNVWSLLADHHVDISDDTQPYHVQHELPDRIREGQRVFVKTELLEVFVSMLLPRITTRFVLLSGHSDMSPSHEVMMRIQADPRITKWYAVNASWTDFKTVPIPIGLSESWRPIGDQDVVAACMAAAWTRDKRRHSVFCPAMGPTHPVRKLVWDLDHAALTKASPGNTMEKYGDYLTELGKYAFVLCPRGNGIDVHRVHEAILMRTVPIYISDHTPAVFQYLPVICVQSLADLVGVLDDLPNNDLPSRVDWEAAQRYLMVDAIPDVYGPSLTASQPGGDPGRA